MEATNVAMDLSLRSMSLTREEETERSGPLLVKPVPRLPWTITWYQSLWSQPCASTDHRPQAPRTSSSFLGQEGRSGTECTSFRLCGNADSKCLEKWVDKPSSLVTIFDIACCDGPVVFERVSNPNFALTVEHTQPDKKNDRKEEEASSSEEGRQLSMKTYLCIYCNQSFKSLFCYQKHKKRHLNPVSIDITATHHEPPVRATRADSNNKTKDLNVQFFPCKKCGSKFPSYYFVHKHRKVCHNDQVEGKVK